jgi:hypothetical protein
LGPGGEQGARRSSKREDHAQQQVDQRGPTGAGRGRGGGDGGRPAATGAAGREDLSDVKVLYTNEQSIIGKIDKLASTASDMTPDLILLTETWCN